MRETDPTARLKLMEQAVKKQQEQSLQRLLDREMAWLPPPARERLSQAPFLTSEKLQELTAALLENARPHLSPSEIEMISGQQGVRQSVSLLQMLRDKDVSIWTDEALFRALSKVIGQSGLGDLRQELEGRQDPRPLPEAPRMISTLVLTVSLIRELQQEQVRLANPGNDDLTSLLDSLPADEQDRLLSLESSEFREELMHRHEQKQNPVKVEEVVRLLAPPDDMRQRFQGPGGRNRPPFGTRGGEREPFPGEGPPRVPNSPPPRNGFGTGFRDRPGPFQGPPPEGRPDENARRPPLESSPPGEPAPRKESP
jgi:hypothetical protein